MATYEGWTSEDEWIDSRGQRWFIAVHWGVIAGRAEPVSFNITSAWVPGLFNAAGTELMPPTMPDGSPLVPFGEEVHRVSGQLLREIPFRELLRDMWGTYEALFPATEAFNQARERTGSSYEEVAAVYTNAWATDDTPSPTLAVARHFNISKSAAAKRIARARERGLLPPTERGRARGV